MKTRIVGCDVALKARQYGLTLFTLSLFHAFAGNAQSVVGRWIGVYTQYDLDQFCTIPVYMDLLPDTTWRLGLLDNTEEPKLGKWAALPGDTLLLGGVRYGPGLVFMRGDSLRIGLASPMIFRRFRPVPLNANEVWHRLAGQVWQSDSTQFWIQLDGKVGVVNRRTNVQTIQYAQVLNLTGSSFWQLRGNAFGPNKQVHDSRQVIHADAKTVQFAGWNGRNAGVETFRWVRAMTPRDTLRQSGFVSCEGCLGLGVRFRGYHETEQTRQLKALFTRQYQPVDLPGQSGMILVSFTINCRGDHSSVQLRQYNADYRVHSFDLRIMNQIQILCRDRLENEWFGFSEKELTEGDIAVQFTIRLLDGRITEVY